MNELRCLLVLIVAVAGCGGSARTIDAGGADDAWSAPMQDAWTPAVDAWAAPMDDAWTPPGSGGACTNTADEAVSTGATFSDDLGNCAMHGTMDPALMTCIEGLGLSSGCAMCFDAQVHCTVAHCVVQCIGGDSPGCTMCRATNCDAAFTACSGVTP